MWNRRVYVRLPSNKKEARALFQSIGRVPIEHRRSKGARQNEQSRGDMEMQRMLEAEGWFDTTITHNVHIPQLDEIMDLIQNLVTTTNVSEAISEKLVTLVLKMVLLAKLDLSDWTAVSAWALDTLRAFGVSLNMITSFLKRFAHSASDRLRAESWTDLNWLDFISNMFSMMLFSVELPKQAMAAIIKIGGAARGISNIWQLIEKVAKDGIPLIYKYVTGYPYEIAEMETYFAGIKDWYTAIHELIDVDTQDQVAVSQEKCKEIEDLFRQGMTFISRAQELRMDQKMIRAIEFHFGILKTYYDRVQASGAFKCSPRIEPLVICLTGEPGVGKSGMMHPLAIELLKASGMKDKNWTERIYTRNVNQEFWDGYNQQEICLYDDFGQKVDTIAAPNEEFFEIIKTANLAPYNLHMASIHEKSRTFFRSKVILLSSNDSYFAPASLRHPSAVRRRIDIHCKVTVKPEFRKQGTDRLDPLKVKRILGTAWSTDVYEIYMLDPMTGYLAEDKGYSYDEFVGRTLAKFDRKMNSGREQLEFLERLACQGEEEESFEDARETPVAGMQYSIHQLYAVYSAGYRTPFIGYESGLNERGFRAKLLSREMKLRIQELQSIIEDPMFENTEPELSRLFRIKQSVTSYAKDLKEKAMAHYNTFMWRMHPFIEKVKEVWNSYPMVRAFVTAFTLMKVFQWFSPKQKPVKANLTPRSNKKRLGTEIASSGDLKTVQQKLRTELASSGDPKTVRNRELRTELASSGDPKTQKSRELRTEEQTERQKEIVDQQIMLQANGAEIHAELQADPNAFSLSKKLHGNTYTIEVLNGAQSIGRMKGFFLVGRIFITAGHLLHTLERGTAIRLTNPSKKNGFVIPVERLQIERVYDHDGEEKDQILIDCSRLVHDHANILSSVATSQELKQFKRAHGVLITPQNENVIFRYGKVEADDRVREYESDHAVYQVRQHYRYDLETTKGDCGSPLVVISTLLPRKLVGMHVAGGTGIGISSPLNFADIEKAVKRFGNDAKVDLQTQDWVQELKTAEDMIMPQGDFMALGKAEYKEGGFASSSIRPSEIHGYKNPVSMPSALGKVYIDGKWIDPMMQGLKKCAVPSVGLEPELLRAAVNGVKKNFSCDPERQRVLTNQEAMEGIEGDPFAAPIKRTTSSGYPFKRMTKKPGKTEWCGSDEEYVMHPLMTQKLREREEAALRNQRYPTVWVDTLKDERRPIEKVKAGKTRVFSAGPVDYILAMRKYFLGFTSHCASRRNVNEISVGTNVYSTDWDVIATLLRKHGDHVIAGDFSNFDGTLNVEILHEMIDIINDWYDDGEDNKQIRRILWRECLNSVHVCGETIYMWTHSQPSGNPLTAVLNSIYNAIACRYVWMLVTKDYPELHSMKAFRENVSMVCYGDDNVLNISEKAIDCYNQITMAEAFSSFGMTYTDEGKSGTLVKSRTLPEVNYLKRAFKYDEDLRCWLAPLDLTTILEIPNWIRNCVDPAAATESNIEDAIAELALHGEDVFQQWSERMLKAAEEQNLTPFSQTHYEYMVSERYVKGMLEAFA
jgi:V8-like Glu-specific endopeptidase